MYFAPVGVVYVPEPDAYLVTCGAPVVSCIVPLASGRLSVRSVLLFGLAMVNVPVPEALPDKAILLMLVLLPELQPVRSKL
jgi:hypothetical protein